MRNKEINMPSYFIVEWIKFDILPEINEFKYRLLFQYMLIIQVAQALVRGPSGSMAWLDRWPDLPSTGAKP